VQAHRRAVRHERTGEAGSVAPLNVGAACERQRRPGKVFPGGRARRARPLPFV